MQPMRLHLFIEPDFYNIIFIIGTFFHTRCFSCHSYNLNPYQTPDWLHKSSYCSDCPERFLNFLRIFGNVLFPVFLKSELDHILPGLLQALRYCHTLSVLSVLGRLRKNNITQYNMKIKQAILHSSSVFDI